MADLSFSFKWSQASSLAVQAASAISAVAARSATWDKASDASAAAIAASSNAAIALSSAANASSVVAVLDTTVIKSIPAAQSRAVHEIMMTSAGLLKYVYSSNAAA